MGQRGTGSGTLVRVEPRDREAASSTRLRTPQRRPPRFAAPAWGIAAAILALVGLTDTIVTQVVFSAYAAAGAGANKVAAPPRLVSVSLVASALVGLLLALEEWRRTRWRPRWRLDPGDLWARLRTAPRRLRVAWRPRLSQLYSLTRIPIARAAAWRRDGIQLTMRGWVIVWLIGLALGASLAADIGAVAPAARPVAQWVWIGSVALLLAAAWVLDRGRRTGPWTSPRAARWGWPDWALLGLLVAGALALRLPDLTGQPYVVHGDEAWCGLEALRWLNGGVPSLLSTGWYGLPVAGYGLPALVMHFAGASLWGLRLSSVLIGTLSIVLLYALAREFTGRRVAFVAAALLTVSHFHIEFSRTGIHYIHALAVVLVVLWLLARALRRGSAVAAVLAAAGMSLSLQVYFGARIVFVIVPLFLLGLALFRRSALAEEGAVSAWRKTAGWLALGLPVTVGPLAVYFQQNAGALTSRTAEVLILNRTPYRLQTLQAQFGTTDLRAILGRQLAAVPLLPGGLADQTLQYGPRYPMLDPLVAALVLVGFWYAICTLRRPLSLLLVLWVLGVILLGGVLTIDMPSWPRLFVMLPALCLLAALAVDGLFGLVARSVLGAVRLAPAWRIFKWRPRASTVGRHGGRAVRTALGAAVALSVIGFSLGQTLQHYFVQYPKTMNSDTYQTRYTDLAYYAAMVPNWTHVVLYDSGDLLLDYSTVRFLAPGLSGERVQTSQALRQALARRAGPVTVIVPPEDMASFGQLLAEPGALPPGSLQPVRDRFGLTAFYTYSIP